MIFKSILKMTSAKLCFGSTSKTRETDPSLRVNARQYIGPVNAPSSIESKQGKRLGFMEGEGRVPDDFNKMGASEIESMFYDNK
tara:strand:- start:162 stop:413 length:252 start_codon:yes stop_codon:yes gene_type:complete